MRCASPSKRKHPLSYLTRPVGPSVRQVIKTIGGLVPIVLLWLLPLFYAAIGRQSASTARMAAKLSLLWAECIVSSVSTAIVQVFLCDRFDDGDYLRAQRLIVGILSSCDYLRALRLIVGIFCRWHYLGALCLIVGSFLDPTI